MSKAILLSTYHVYYDFTDNEIFATLIPPEYMAVAGTYYWCDYLGEL